MSSEITAEDYARLRAEKLRREKSPAQKKRRHEQWYRSGVARSRALTVLGRMYPEEYRLLYRYARAEVHAERGPLPGDDA